MSMLPLIVDGDWSNWGEWSDCTETCGSGNIVRHRDCDSPAPQNGGQPCSGLAYENVPCQVSPCPGKEQNKDMTQLTIYVYKLQ